MTQTRYEYTRIYEQMLRTTFCNIEDALHFSDGPKVRFYVGTYAAGQGTQSWTEHFMDVHDARVVFTDLAYGRSITYEESKGNPNKTPVVSRYLKINTNKEKAKVYLEFIARPGRITGLGLVTATKAPPLVEVNIGLSLWQARRMGHAVLHYLAAHDVCRMLVQQGYVVRPESQL